MNGAVVFVDFRVDESDVLLADLPKNVDVIFLSRDRVGTEQITEALRLRSDAQSIHQIFGELTNADVAASNNRTGSNHEATTWPHFFEAHATIQSTAAPHERRARWALGGRGRVYPFE